LVTYHGIAYDGYLANCFVFPSNLNPEAGAHPFCHSLPPKPMAASSNLKSEAGILPCLLSCMP